MDDRSPAQLFALVVGLALVLAGVAGFFYSASFATGDSVERDALLGVMDVNGWHNTAHVLTGAIGLLVAGSYAASRIYALAVGAVYLLLALVGLIVGAGEVIVGLIPVNTENNLVHLLIAIAGLGAGLATPATLSPSLAEARAR